MGDLRLDSVGAGGKRWKRSLREAAACLQDRKAGNWAVETRIGLAIPEQIEAMAGMATQGYTANGALSLLSPPAKVGDEGNFAKNSSS